MCSRSALARKSHLVGAEVLTKMYSVGVTRFKTKLVPGGMATVYRRQDQVLDRTDAIKMMLPQYTSDHSFAARFKQEAQAAALESPVLSPFFIARVASPTTLS